MGIYDRDYERQRSDYNDSPGFHLGGEMSWTTKLVIVMGIVYVVQLLTRVWRSERGRLVHRISSRSTAICRDSPGWRSSSLRTASCTT